MGRRHGFPVAERPADLDNSTGVERLRQINQGMARLQAADGRIRRDLPRCRWHRDHERAACSGGRTHARNRRPQDRRARRHDIVAQFLSESVTISLAGAVVGAVVGFSGAVGITAIIRWRTSTPMYAAFTWQTFVVSMGTAIAIGLIFGTYPALKAARLSPVDACATSSPRSSTARTPRTAPQLECRVTSRTSTSHVTRPRFMKTHRSQTAARS